MHIANFLLCQRNVGKVTMLLPNKNFYAREMNCIDATHCKTKREELQ